MRRALFSIVGLLLAGGAVVAFCYAIYSMGHIGTCASGGPYVSARPCPAGTGVKIALIPIAVFGGLLGIAVYSGGIRWERESPIGLGLLMWSFTFLGAAGSLAYGAWGPASSDVDGGGVQMAAIILLVIFVPMGVIPLIAAFFGRSRSSRTATPTIRMTPPAAPVAPRPTVGSPSPRSGVTASSAAATAASLRAGLAMSGPASPSDVVTRLERLDGLRKSGAITDAEFDRLKARLLSGG